MFAVRLVLSKGKGLVGGIITHLRCLIQALVVVVDGGGFAGCCRRWRWMGGGGGGGGKTVCDVAVTHNRIWRPVATSGPRGGRGSYYAIKLQGNKLPDYSACCQ
jgi:hypothetical protein